MDTDVQKIRLMAMNLLAMREHSAYELQQKLLRKFAQSSSIDKVITLLVEQQLLSDRRFTESFIAMRFRQMKGPLLIFMELKAKGIDPLLIESCLAELDLDWDGMVQKLRVKKFGLSESVDVKDKAKQMRYLQSRGFASQHVRAAFSQVE